MAYTMRLAVFVIAALLLHDCVDAKTSKHDSSLRDHYYRKTCPDAESVIRKAVNAELDKNLKLAGGLIRMQYHDCFVGGCDASVLLDGNDTEKTAIVNEHLRGFEVVDAARTAVEKMCPGVVSCADIIAYAARDSTVKLKGRDWKVQGGRKDGNFSSAVAADNDIPRPTFNVSQLIDSFTRRGLTAKQMVILSGSHTVGTGHCDSFIDRLYNFSETHSTDPTLNSTYAKQLKKECPKHNYNTTLELFMDTVTPAKFDSNYFVGLTQRKSLFTSDQSLFEDRHTKKIVKKLLNKNRFEHRFGHAMRAMAAAGVHTEGQVRKNCRVINVE